MTRTLRVFLALTIGLTLAAGPVSAAAAPAPSQVIAQAAATATISGTVKDDQGSPVPGADVFIVGPGNYETHTDARGAFTITNVKPGLYSVAVTKPGYSSATQEDVAIAPGANEVVNATMVAATTQSLRLIGTVTATAGRGKFNTSGLSISTLDSAQITSRVQPNLKDVVSELPGVIASRDANGRSPNSSFQVRGGQSETKVTIDGHAISSGVFGTYNNNYANSEIFEQVEVLKGAGLNGVNAGESAFGTINLRTKNFQSKNGYTISASTDSFGSGWLNFLANYNVGKWSFLAARSFQGFNGPDQYVTNALIGNTLGGTTNPGHGNTSLIQWTNTLANPYSSEADLLKARYKFSQATWLTGEWLNLTGRYYNQGGSYAYYDGMYTVPQCSQGGVFIPAGAPGCGVTSTYNPPFLTNLVGTTQPLYNFFPNSQILNNEPQFSFELRTTHKNDTFFLRPYRTEIKRDINGSTENQQIGYGAPGGWYMVTSTANCQVTFSAPTAAGAKGPCFTSANGYAAPYIGAPNPAQPVVFVTTPNAPACSVAAPCWTTPTNAQRNGYWGYNTPFSQPEIDRLSGTTFTWLHPVGPHLYTFSVDYSRDNTLKFTADNSPLPAGCNPVVAGGLPNLPTTSTGAPNPYYQPNCTVGGAVLASLPATALQIPPTTNYKTDYSLTALWQINPKLQIGLGNYLTVEKLDYVYTDPAAALAAANTKASNGKALSGAEPADSTLLHGIAQHTHYDPHLQIQYRATLNTSYRLTAGSSITTPWASLVSGFAKLSPNLTPTTDSQTVPNPNLQPETTVAYDFGFDHHFSEGSVISADYFNNTIHNPFVTYGQAGPPLPNRPGITTLITNQTVNGPLERDYGVEFTAQKAPPVGLGYYVTATAQRAYFDGFTDAFYQQLAAAALASGTPAGKNPFIALVNGKQLDGTSGFQGQIPFFKAKIEGNWRAKNNAYYAVGTDILGSNNPYGVGHGFNLWYGNATWDIGKDFAFSIAGENLGNYNTGSQTGNVVNLAGAQIVGVRWNALTNKLEYGNPSFFPASAVVVKPPNLYFTLTKKL